MEQATDIETLKAKFWQLRSRLDSPTISALNSWIYEEHLKALEATLRSVGEWDVVSQAPKA